MRKHLLRKVVPEGVVTAESREDLDVELFSEELGYVQGAVPARRAEFATARHLARVALRSIGASAPPIHKGLRGEPVWPPQISGSITHCDGFRGAAVMWALPGRSVGIDAEPSEPLPSDILPYVASGAERRKLQELGSRDGTFPWGRILFSAKESIFKAQYPLTSMALDFLDVQTTLSASGVFEWSSYVPGAPLTQGKGRWFDDDGLIVTCTFVEIFSPTSHA